MYNSRLMNKTTSEIETYEGISEAERMLITARDAVRLSRMARYKAMDFIYEATGEDGADDVEAD